MVLVSFVVLFRLCIMSRCDIHCRVIIPLLCYCKNYKFILLFYYYVLRYTEWTYIFKKWIGAPVRLSEVKHCHSDKAKDNVMAASLSSCVIVFVNTCVNERV